MELVAWTVGGIVVGTLMGLLFARLCVPTITGWVLRRRYERSQPPKGTRPQVRIRVVGITYDVTDELIRMPDDEDGMAIWAVVGPPHVRIKHGDEVAVVIRQPEPKDTRVQLHVSGPPEAIRFETPDEIRKHYAPE